MSTIETKTTSAASAAPKVAKAKKPRKSPVSDLGPIIKASSGGRSQRKCTPVERMGMVQTVPVVRKKSAKAKTKGAKMTKVGPTAAK